MKVNSWTDKYHPKAYADADSYKEEVAEPVMRAVDQLPKAYRALVNEYGYVDVYRAWCRGMSADAIRSRAEAAGGKFVL